MYRLPQLQSYLNELNPQIHILKFLLQDLTHSDLNT